MRGKLIVISGLSGAGKGTIAKKLVENYNNFVLSISATTRDKRLGESDGEHYFFVSKNQFEEMIKNGELIEHAKYVDNYYGTPKKYVIDKLDSGKNVILEIEMQGALQIKKIFSDAILVFIMPPDAKTQYLRLKGRGRENDEQIIDRLKQSIVDASYAKYYDYVLVNDNLEIAIKNITKIVKENFDEKNKLYNLELLDKLVNDVKEENYV